MTIANQIIALGCLTGLAIIVAVAFGYALGLWAVRTGRARS